MRGKSAKKKKRKEIVLLKSQQANLESDSLLNSNIAPESRVNNTSNTNIRPSIPKSI